MQMLCKNNTLMLFSFVNTTKLCRFVTPIIHLKVNIYLNALAWPVYVVLVLNSEAETYL